MKIISLLLIALMSYPLAPLVEAQMQKAPEYDIVIRNGRVLDGSGNPWINADVAINGGRFVAIGHVTGHGRREIDAHNLYVSPGWIDVMDQSSKVLLKNGFAENKLREGVTTVIAGEGGTPVPAEQIGDYFAQLQRQGISVNFGCYYSEAQARIAILGQSSRAPSPAELERMKALMAVAMKNGAMGMTTALIYAPSSYASTDELIAMAKVAGEYGGIYASHMRDEGAGVVSAVDELIRIAEEGHISAEIFHLKVAYQPAWGKLMQVVGQHVDAARARGVEIAADLYVYTSSGTGLEITIPTWAFEGGIEKLKERLGNPEIRERLKREQISGYAGWSNYIEAAGGWDGITLVGAANPVNSKYEGKTMTEVAKEMGTDPADAAFDLVIAGEPRVTATYRMMSEQDIDTALRFPWTSIGSDGGASLTAGGPTDLKHPRAYGNFPRVIAKYVRQEHVLTLEDAIRKMTGWPSDRFRLAGRGLIREGQWADVTIFDYDSLQDNSTYETTNVFPSGVKYVLVNGVVVIDNEKHTGATPGMVLYGPGHQAAGRSSH